MRAGYIDLVLDNGTLVRVEYPAKHEDDVLESIDNARARGDTYLVPGGVGWLQRHLPGARPWPREHEPRDRHALSADNAMNPIEQAAQALRWYEHEAKALAKHLQGGAHTQAVIASLTVLSLDAGRRAEAARAALASLEAAKQEPLTDAQLLSLAREHVSPYLAGLHPKWFVDFGRAVLAAAHSAVLLTLRAAHRYGGSVARCVRLSRGMHARPFVATAAVPAPVARGASSLQS